MSKFKESFKFKDSLIVNGERLDNNGFSGKIIGEVTCEEYDKTGKLLFSETTTNDVTLPGSIYVLEQIFKKASNGYRFLHPSTPFPVGTYMNQGSDSMSSNFNTGNLSSSEETDKYLIDEKIFGFMVGNGGETSTSIIAPKYEANKLQDQSNKSTFLPFRIISSGSPDPNDDGIDYHLKLNSGSNNYYYAKGFASNPIITTKWADGSGTVGTDVLNYNTPILTYAEATLNIDEEDIREYFGSTASQQCFINQLGLVAGKPTWVQDTSGRYKPSTMEYEIATATELSDNSIVKYEKHGSGTSEYYTVSNDFTETLYVLKNFNTYELISEEENTNYAGPRYRLEYNDVKLVTTLNFKSKDLSNSENKLKFIYRVYCL